MTNRRYWLFKSEPDAYSIGDLAREKNGVTCWDGVRNYQARNFLRDEIRIGDGILFHHSSCEPTGIAGTAVVTKDGYPDHTQFEEGHPHFDPGVNTEAPRWYMVDIALERRFPSLLTLQRLREEPGLAGMVLLQRGSRLSIQPVSEREWEIILALADARPGSPASLKREHDSMHRDL